MSKKIQNIPQLSRRLLMAASLVSSGNTVADIGCDHAHTSIYLVKQGISPKAVAMDVRSGPLERAAQNILLYDCSEKIDTRLSDGLEKLGRGETDTILITGMGGVLMTEIFRREDDKLKAAKELVLSPQSHPDLVRRYILDAGFTIVREEMCFEDGKYYVAIKASREEAGSETTDAFSSTWKEDTELRKKSGLMYGSYLIAAKDEVLFEYLKKEERKTQRVISQMKEQGTEQALSALPEFEEKMGMINEALRNYVP